MPHIEVTSIQEERRIAAEHPEDCRCDVCDLIREEYEAATW